MRTLAFIALLVCGTSERLHSQEPSSGAEDEQVAEALRLTTAAAKDYEFVVLTDPAEPRPVRLRPQPVLRWSNPIAGTVYGNVFLWTDGEGGPPVVVGSLLKWFSPFQHSAHEFHSLTTEKIEGSRQQKTVWRPSRGGITWQSLGQLSPPAATVAARLRQMRDAARKYTARKTDREGVDRELRLLNQPVYRYQDRDRGIVDGSVFAFVQGTDPEVLLLIEAVTNDGTMSWRHAFARLNSEQLEVRRADQKIWRVETLPWVQVRNRDEPYTSSRVD